MLRTSGRFSGALSLALATTIALLVGGCTEPTHIDSDVAHSYRTNAEMGPLPVGWDWVWIGRLLDRPAVIAHKIAVQSDFAGDLVRMSGSELRKVVSAAACPAADHQIWQQISARQDVEVVLSTKKNGPFATISCRAAVL